MLRDLILALETQLKELHEQLVARVLRKAEPERMLFLAVPEPVFETFFAKPFIQEAIIEEELNLIIYSIEKATIISWIK